jgi:hypothetical protein
VPELCHIPPERLLKQRDLRGHGDAHVLLREVVEVNCVAAIDMHQARAPGAVEKVQQALEIEDDRGNGRGLFEYAPVRSNDLPADDAGAAKHDTWQHSRQSRDDDQAEAQSMRIEIDLPSRDSKSSEVP